MGPLRRLAVVCGPLLPGLALAATISVSTTTDELNTDGDCSLREAVVAANTDAAVDACTAGSGDDLILLPAGTFTLTLTGAAENAAATGDLDLTGTVVIGGATRPTTILEGGLVDRVFEVRSGATVTLSSMTIRNTTPAQAGAAVMNRSTLTVDDCDFDDNVADGTTGGAIYSLSGTTLTVTNSVFDGNLAETNGGAIANHGAAVLQNVTFISNTATEQGGAIYQSPNGTLDVDAVSFLLNDAGEDGGALYTDAPTTIVYSSFYLNTAGTAGLGGAAIACSDTVSLEASTIAYNTSDTYAGGISVNGVCTLTLTNVTVHGNDAVEAGGGIRTAGGGTIVVASSTITGNQSNSDGSGVDGGGGIDCSTGGTVTVRNTVIAENVDDATPSDCEGTLTSEGYNLLETTTACTMATTTGDLTGVDPMLGTLASNGGFTDTRVPDAGSPLVDAGNPGTPGSGGATCPIDDQRGYGRPAGSACDIGAVERDGTPPTTTTTVATTTTTLATTTTTTAPSTTTTVVTTTTLATTTTTPAVTTTTTTLSTTTSTAAPTSTSTSTSIATTLPPPPPPTTTTLPPPLCQGGAPMQDMTLRLTRLGGTAGDERMILAGTLMLPPGTPPVLAPQTSGAQLLVEDLGAGGALVDLTARTAAIPPGSRGAGCHPKDGWTGTTYQNRSGAIGAGCRAGSAQGLRRMKLKDRRSRGRGVTFSVQVSDVALPAPQGPVRVTLVLGAEGGAGATGECGIHAFTATCSRKGATYRCR